MPTRKAAPRPMDPAESVLAGLKPTSSAVQFSAIAIVLLQCASHTTGTAQDT